MITRVSSVIRPEGSDLTFDHPADYGQIVGSTRGVFRARILPGYGWTDPSPARPAVPIKGRGALSLTAAK